MILWAVVACTNTVVGIAPPPAFLDTGFRPAEPPAVEETLSNPCGVCHSGLAAAGQLNLIAGAWGNLVNQRAVGQPDLFRVVPGDPDASYLIHKLRGTHLDVGGSGEAMPPQGYEMLEPRELQVVVDWIEQGAAPFP